MPDFEIREWNEDNFDVSIIPYTAEAYRQKKYAFVSDYARFWILYHYGGLYFDTDVEVIRPMDDVIERGCFMGFEVDPDGENSPAMYAPRYAFAVNPGLGTGFPKDHHFLQRMMHLYATLTFHHAEMNPWLKTIVAYTTEILMEEGLQSAKGIQQVGDITVYPHEYFAPINVISGKLHITPNTYTIHHYMGSWDNKSHSAKDFVRNMLPEWVFVLNNRIKRRKFRIK
jgi:mannosyltransferase OCH1-like enzyme